MNNKTLNIYMNLKGFDFNKLDMQFFQRQLANIYQKNMANLSETLRWWAAERIANPRSKVNYQITVDAKAGSELVNAIQYFDMVGDTAIEPALSVILATGAQASALVAGLPMTPPMNAVDMLGEYDREYNANKANMAAEFHAAYHALRNVLVEAGRFATGCYIGLNYILFIANEGDVSHVVKIATQHLFDQEYFLKANALK